MKIPEQTPIRNGRTQDFAAFTGVDGGVSPHLVATAAGLAAVIEGLWLRCALSNGPLTVDQARMIARDYVTRFLNKD